MLTRFFIHSSGSTDGHRGHKNSRKNNYNSLRSSSRSHSSRSKQHTKELQAKVVQICDWLQYFCGLFDSRFGIEEVEQLLLNPPVVNDDDIRAAARPLVKFDELLRLAQFNPQDWFDFVVHHHCHDEMGEAVIYHPTFVISLNKLASDLHRPYFSDSDIHVLYSFILKGHHHYMLTDMDEGLDAFDLAVAFAKFRMPAHQISFMNHVASVVDDIGNFIREYEVDLLSIDAISPKNARLGIMSRKELERVISVLLSRNDATIKRNNTNNKIDKRFSNSRDSSMGFSSKSFLSTRTTSILSDKSSGGGVVYNGSSIDKEAHIGISDSDPNKETKQLDVGSLPSSITNVPLSAGEDITDHLHHNGQLPQNQNANNLSSSSNSGKSVSTRKSSMFGSMIATLQCVASSLSSKQKRDSIIAPDCNITDDQEFFDESQVMKANLNSKTNVHLEENIHEKLENSEVSRKDVKLVKGSQVVPNMDVSNDHKKAHNGNKKEKKVRNSSISRSFLDLATAFDFRNQLANFLQGDEAQRLHIMSAGKLNLDVNSEEPLMINEDRSSRRQRRHRQRSAQRRYSALLKMDSVQASKYSLLIEENEEEADSDRRVSSHSQTDQCSHDINRNVPTSHCTIGHNSTEKKRHHHFHYNSPKPQGSQQPQLHHKQVLEGFDARVNIVKSISSKQYGG